MIPRLSFLPTCLQTRLRRGAFNLKSFKKGVFHFLAICVIGASFTQALQAAERLQGGKNADNDVRMPMPVDDDTAADCRGDAPQRQYQAKWIWAKVQAAEPFQFVRFRKTFDLDAAPEKATAFVTADTFYRLWINGALVMHGPARSSAGKITVDPVDVDAISEARQKHRGSASVSRGVSF